MDACFSLAFRPPIALHGGMYEREITPMDFRAINRAVSLRAASAAPDAATMRALRPALGSSGSPGHAPKKCGGPGGKATSRRYGGCALPRRVGKCRSCSTRGPAVCSVVVFSPAVRPASRLPRTGRSGLADGDAARIVRRGGPPSLAAAAVHPGNKARAGRDAVNRRARIAQDARSRASMGASRP
jgi:hypothetical protein